MTAPRLTAVARQGRALAAAFLRPFRRMPRTDLLVLLAVIVGYTAVLTELSLLRNAAFYTSNWDLGINQQMLWSTGHGRLLYESGDHISFGINSYLELHSTYIALAFVPLYLALPTPGTLFALQAALVALAILPLYLLTVEASRSRSLAFGLVALYLASFEVISALLFDFHWESFLPVEFLTLWYLYTHRHYRAALVVLGIGCATLEIFPFLAVLVPLAAAFSSPLFPRTRTAFRELPRRVVLALRSPGLRTGLTFGLACVAGYIVVRLLQWFVFPHLLGQASSVTSLSQAGALSGLGGTGYSSLTLNVSAAYWLLFAASLAFLPFVAPEYLVLVLPWFAYATFVEPSFSSVLGFQYPLVAAGPLLVAAVQGLGRLRRWYLAPRSGRRSAGLLLLAGSGIALAFLTVEPGSAALVSLTTSYARVQTDVLPILVAFGLGALLLGWAHARPTPAGGPRAAPRARVRLRRPAYFAGLAVVVALLAFNLAFSPLNTANYTTLPGYRFSYTPSPVAADLGSLTGDLPAGATVLASDFLFPAVANDVNAVSLPWFGDFGALEPYFPFTASHLPPYALIDSEEYSILPGYLQSAFWNASLYGLRGAIYATGWPGTVYLFEAGYHGPSVIQYASPPPSTVWLGAPNLSIGPLGFPTPNATSRFGTVIESHFSAPGPAGDLNVWYGPYAVYPAGAYVLTLNLSVAPLLGVSTEATPVLTIDGGPAYLPYLFNETLVLSEFPTSGWEELHVALTIPEPYPMMEFRGYLVTEGGSPVARVTLNYLELGP